MKLPWLRKEAVKGRTDVRPRSDNRGRFTEEFVEFFVALLRVYGVLLDKFLRLADIRLYRGSNRWRRYSRILRFQNPDWGFGATLTFWGRPRPLP